MGGYLQQIRKVITTNI